jgi:endonuclease/exonuclease/phosphatase family metal-dependent hydrolase
MTTPRKVVLLALAALMLVPATALAGSSKKSKTTNVTVMTRNLYLGADIISLATATDRNDFEQKATALFQTVGKTDFKSRSALIADEIKKNKPDFVGMQEVALWRKGADGVKDGSATPATEVVYDWMADLKAELKKRKLKYKVARVQTEFDFEGPTSMGHDIRFTQQDAVLVRSDRKIKTKKAKSANYDAAFQVPLNSIGETANVKRGYIYVDATVNGAKFRFVDTHLEAYSEDIGLAQAKELTKGPLRGKGQKVLVGDMNSEIGSDASDPIDHLLDFGLDDTFFTKTRRDTKTCCQAEDVANAESQLKSRIDFILAKPKVPVVKSLVVGNKPSVKTPNGLWPSDHAGVVSKLKLKTSR